MWSVWLRTPPVVILIRVYSWCQFLSRTMFSSRPCEFSFFIAQGKKAVTTTAFPHMTTGSPITKLNLRLMKRNLLGMGISQNNFCMTLEEPVSLKPKITQWAGISFHGHELSSVKKGQVPCPQRTGSSTSSNQRPKHPVTFHHLAETQGAWAVQNYLQYTQRQLLSVHLSAHKCLFLVSQQIGSEFRLSVVFGWRRCFNIFVWLELS